jgi:hypothetical protein
MYTCIVDPTLERTKTGEMTFPLGVYPVETIEPKPGYAVEFESADGAEDGSDLEEWPDRYVYDIVISADKLPALVLQLMAMMPLRVYPILDFLGHDDFREIDPYISYERLGVDRIIDGLRQFTGFFYEDGMCGFGAMSEEPFIYLFVDEHKILTIRAEASLKGRVVELLHAFGLEEMPEPVGVDGAAHEHRSVLVVPDGRENVLAAEEIVGYLRQEWRLTLNVNPESNVDDEDNELGVTGWRCVVRFVRGQDGPVRYAEVLLWAGNIAEAEVMIHTAIEEMIKAEGESTASDEDSAPTDEESIDDDWADLTILALDRLSDEHLESVWMEVATASRGELKPREPRVIVARWLE